MTGYFIKRLFRKQLIVAFLLFSTISIIHGVITYFQLSPFKLIENTPYTKWLVNDSMNIFSLIYFLLLPLLISIAVSDIYFEDKENGLDRVVRINSGKMKYDLSLFLYTSIAAVLIVNFSLVLNLLILFLSLPNLKPDQIINYNFNANSTSVLFPHLFFEHPLLNIILLILNISIWTVLFNLVSITASIFFNKRVFSILFSFLSQLILIIFNSITPYFLVKPPVYFLEGRLSFMDITWDEIIITFIFYLILSLTFYFMGNYKNENP